MAKKKMTEGEAAVINQALTPPHSGVIQTGTLEPLTLSTNGTGHDINVVLARAIETGIPLARVVFHAPVNNADDVPESGLSDSSNKPSRKAEMWLTNIGYVFKQKNAQKKTIYFGTPTANVSSLI